MSRIQTVDTVRGPLEQLCGLSTVIVTTASAKGAIRIEGLEHERAAELAERLTPHPRAARGRRLRRSPAAAVLTLLGFLLADVLLVVGGVLAVILLPAAVLLDAYRSLGPWWPARAPCGARRSRSSAAA